MRNADYRWTKPKVMDFLRHLARYGSVAAAAREVGMSRQSAYNLRARLGAEFDDVWTRAIVLSHTARQSQGDTMQAS